MIVLTWFTPGHFILGPDLQVPVDMDRWLRQCWAWNDQWGTGLEWSVGFSNLIFSAVSAAVSLVTPSLLIVQRMLFVFWFVLPGLTCFFLSMELVPDPKKWAFRLGMVNFYMFNLYLQALWGGNEAGLGAYAALPLLLTLYLRGLRTRRLLFHALLLGPASLLLSSASMNIPLMVVVFMACVILIAVHIIRERVYRSIAGMFRIFFYTAGSALLMLLCNTFWALPQLLVNTTKIQVPAYSTSMMAEARGWLYGMSSDTSLANIFRMQGDWTWYQGWYEPYRAYAAFYRHNPWMIALSWVIPAIVLVGAFASRQRLKAAFILFAVLGVVLGTGVHAPFEKTYLWLVDHLPFFWVFRSPWFKFTILTCLGYSFLFGEGVDTLAGLAGKKRPRLLILSFGILLSANMLYAFPITFGKMHPTAAERVKLKPVHIAIPSYETDMAEWINKQPGFFRVLFLPLRMNATSVYPWGLSSTSPAAYPFFKKPLLFDNWGSETDFGNRLTGLFCRAVYGPRSLSATRIAQMLGARYLIQEGDFDYDYYEATPNYPFHGDTPEFVKERLTRQKDLRPVQSFGPLTVYEIDSPRNRFECAFKAAAVLGPLESMADIADTDLLNQGRALVFLNGFEEKQTLDALEKMDRLGMLDALVTVGLPDPDRQALAHKWCREGSSVFVLQTTEGFTSFLPAAPPALVEIPGVSARWVGGLSDAQGLGGSEKWSWVDTNQENSFAHMEIVNTLDHPVRVNLGWKIRSYQRMRDLFLYMNGELFTPAPRISANDPQEVLLPEFSIPPGKMSVRFYTPYQTDPYGTRQVSFAIQPDSLRIGLLNYQGSVWIPAEGSYQAAVQPIPIPETLSGQLEIRIGDNAVILKADSETRRYIAEPLLLKEGNLPLSVRQTAVGGHYLIRFFRAGTAAKEEREPSAVIHENKSTPVSHEVVFENQAPAILVFHESYFPLWKAADRQTGESLSCHFIVNGFGNGFLIEQPGKRTVRIDYSVQERFAVGWRVALLTTVACLGGAFFLLMANRFRMNKKG